MTNCVYFSLTSALYYLSGFKYGFYKTLYPFSIESIFTYILPIVISITMIEKSRYIICVQNQKLPNIIIFIACVLAEFLLLNDFRNINTLKGFMTASAIILLPSITCNLLFHYLVTRYGSVPNIAYKLITSLYLYIIPFVPGTPDLLYAFIKLLFPLIVYVFVDALYEKKIKYAIKKRSTWGYIGSALFIFVLASYVGLVSGQFGYGMIVVGSSSMADEYNVGDVVIYERYENQIIEEGQILIFNKNNKVVIHRVVDILEVSGVNRYYTKGDANEENDLGYIIDSQIIGITDFKISYIGYPTVWINELFNG